MSRAPLDPHRHYCARYCEENVWHLCADAEAGDDRHAIVISNPARTVAVFAQRAAGAPGRPIVWDYHVVLVRREAGGWQIYDADSTLPAPCPAARYLDTAFPPLPSDLARFAPRFRVVDAATYRRTLATDRRHMRDEGGGWHAPPPPWPAIGSGHNLDRFVDMDAPFVGEVLGLAEVRERFGDAAEAPAKTDRS